MTGLMGKYLAAEERRSLDAVSQRIRAIVQGRQSLKSKIASLFRISDRMAAKADQLRCLHTRSRSQVLVRLVEAIAEYNRMGGFAIECAIVLDAKRAFRIMRARLALRREYRRLLEFELSSADD